MKKILFGVAALGLLGLAGAGIGLKAQDTVEAKADAGVSVYLRPGLWDTAGARYAVCYRKVGETEYWKNMTVVGSDTKVTYAVELDSDVSRFFFCRMNGDTAENNWNEGVFWNCSVWHTSLETASDHVFVIPSATAGSWSEIGEWKMYSAYSPVAQEHPAQTLYISTWESAAAPYTFIFDEDWANADWPGNQLSSSLATTATNFYSKGSVYKLDIPAYTSHFERSIIVSAGGDENKSGNLPVVDGAFYYFDGDMGASKFPAYYNSHDPDTTLGAQAAVVWDIDHAIDGATDKSICNITASTCATLYGNYNKLTDKTHINSATFYTYTDNTKESKKNWNYSEIAAQLGRQAGVLAAYSYAPANSSDMESIVVPSAIIIVTIAALGTALVIRKRRAE